MFLSSVTNRGALPALEKSLVYNQARLKVIAENVANIHTPGYRARHLDAAAFQGALRKAVAARGDDPSKALTVNLGREVRTDRHGHLEVTPMEKPGKNILFHDGTNLSIERQMADLAETGMMHELATNLLRRGFERLRQAIRGTVG